MLLFLQLMDTSLADKMMKQKLKVQLQSVSNA